MTIAIGSDSGTILAVFLGLVIFGIIYNELVAWMERRGYTEGFLSLIVALGVFVTLVGVAVVSIPAALITLGAFIASGSPMIIGSIVRYVRKREEDRQALIAELKNDKAA